MNDVLIGVLAVLVYLVGAGVTYSFRDSNADMNDTIAAVFWPVLLALLSIFGPCVWFVGRVSDFAVWVRTRPRRTPKPKEHAKPRPGNYRGRPCPSCGKGETP